jgi:hypothetical protein
MGFRAEGLTETTQCVFPAMFGRPESLEINEDGTISFSGNEAWSDFKAVLAGVDHRRLRRCLECSRIFYAVRGNKQACNEHLALAAVKRSTKAIPEEKRAEYERNRRLANAVKKQRKLLKS